ncbi:MAG: PAS domain S-box protein [Rhodocyclaceae bacterium]|nr:PAS domain S-box protein [Rhodocyclaceae bacterium]MDZ4213306.1 PAS domain S-box protein [Rhodocyclaceae bacterium]
MITTDFDPDSLLPADAQLLDTLPVGILMQISSGEIVTANQRACEILGCSREQLFGKSSEDPDWEVIREDGSPFPGLDHPAMVCLATGDSQRNVHMGLRFPDRTVWLSVNSEPLFLPGAALPYAAVTSFTDISIYKSQQLEQQALSEAIQQSPNSVIIVGLDGNIVYVNDTLCQLTGYTRGELVGRNPRLFSTGKTPRKHYEELWAAMLSGREWWGELHNRNKDGREFVEFAHMMPMRNADGEISGYLGIKEDITERKQMGEELDHYRHHLKELVDERTAELLVTQKELEASRGAAEAANQAKTAFLANMSHEIRTPMNAVIALSHLMLQDIVEPKQRERLLKISTSAQHLLALINDVLDFSKIEAGRLKLEHLDFELASVFDMVTNQIEDQVHAKGLDWKVMVDERVPVFLHGDPLRLGQVLLNFTSNAIKFTSTGRVALKVVMVDQVEQPPQRGKPADGVRLRFSVSDTGSGFDVAIKQRLFRPFEQADVSTTRQHGGTGLGLAICQRIADMMDGVIDVESKPGEGSTFWIEATFGRAQVQASGHYSADLSHCRTLLFCQNPEHLRLLTRMLEGLHMRVQPLNHLREMRPRLMTAAKVGMPYNFVICQASMNQLDSVCSSEIRQAIRNSGLTPVPAYLLATHLEGLGAAQMKLLAERFDALLPLPLTSSVLHDALVSVMRSGDAAARTNPQERPVPTQGSDLQAYACYRLLLVEDNVLNQEVGQDMLHSAGLSADVADNGRDALMMASARHYDLILMDMQMPVMDGLKATRAIRALPGYQQVPIVAMTANAFEDDRRQCYEAGMNDHIAKPVVPERLYQVLRQWLPVPQIESDTTAIPAVPPAPTFPAAAADDTPLPNCPALDIEIGLRSLGGKRERYRQLLDKFMDQHAYDVDRIRAALSAAQLDEARRLAHGLKGVAATLGAVPLSETALAVELPLKAAIQAGTLTQDVEPLLAALDRALQVLLRCIRN